MVMLSRHHPSTASAGKLWPALVAGFGFYGVWAAVISGESDAATIGAAHDTAVSPVTAAIE
jgi:hypothetical protein